MLQLASRPEGRPCRCFFARVFRQLVLVFWWDRLQPANPSEARTLLPPRRRRFRHHTRPSITWKSPHSRRVFWRGSRAGSKIHNQGGPNCAAWRYGHLEPINRSQAFWGVIRQGTYIALIVMRLSQTRRHLGTQSDNEGDHRSPGVDAHLPADCVTEQNAAASSTGCPSGASLGFNAAAIQRCGSRSLVQV